MARGSNNFKLPSKISFFVEKSSYGEIFYGPYMKKPTSVFKNQVGEFLEFKLDNQGNYIRQK